MVEVLLPERLRQKHGVQRKDFNWSGAERPMGQTLELVARRSDGSEFPVDISLNTIHTAHGDLVISYLVDISENKRSAQALHQANEQLALSLEELKTHSQELALLGEMGNMLQSCSHAQEIHAIVASYAEKLFVNCSGALYLTDEAGDQYQAAVTWGKYPPEEPTFTADKCWALRRGQVHYAKIPQNGLNCKHINPTKYTHDSEYLCVPMYVQGQAKGLFHLHSINCDPRQSYQQLAVAVVEHVSMSLSNLALREYLQKTTHLDLLTSPIHPL
jgi:hypothetical protein